MRRRFKSWRSLITRQDKSIGSMPVAASAELVAQLRTCRAQAGELTAIRMLRGCRPELSVTEAAEFIRGL